MENYAKVVSFRRILLKLVLSKLILLANSVRLPHWASLVMKLLLIQPSSASAERVFSLLNNAFNDQQDNALEDYLEASVMIRYNKAKRQ